ncbi:hypothetical protein ACSVH2_06685 [Flavobacterium sp. RSB2_4_14]|uniref:hypothetical protein n=1 Tax=Flavobacterium sp. RSB2_4_14 TaxID=3447665 RepID=UPI003F33CC45
MKKLLLPLMILAIAVGLYEQSNDKPNLYIMSIAIVIFMYGMMKLSAKTPSKHTETEEEQDNDN